MSRAATLCLNNPEAVKDFVLGLPMCSHKAGTCGLAQYIISPRYVKIGLRGGQRLSSLAYAGKRNYYYYYLSYQQGVLQKAPQVQESPGVACLLLHISRVMTGQKAFSGVLLQRQSVAQAPCTAHGLHQLVFTLWAFVKTRKTKVVPLPSGCQYKHGRTALRVAVSG